MKTVLSAGVFVAGILAAASATHAAPATAILTDVSGKVLVNDGHGFHPASTSVAIKTGDEIFVASAAGATIHFNEANCDVALGAGTVTRVMGASMCQQALLNAPAVQGLRGSADDLVITPTHGAGTGMIAPGTVAVPVVVGVVAVASGLALVEAWTQSSSSSPVSAP